MSVVATASDLLSALPESGGTAWVRGGEGFVGWGEAARFDPGTGPGRFARAAAALPGLLTEGGVAFASFTFDPEVVGSVVLVPAGLVTSRDERARAAAPVQLVPPPRVVYAGSTIPELAWLEAVDAVAREVRRASSGAKRSVCSDGLQKVVLARDLFVRAADPLDVRLLTARLAARFPSCWTFLVDGLVGATPELLVRRSGREVTSLVLAGSARRGADRGEDARIGAALQASAKDAGEHRLSVESVRAGLAPLCEPVDIGQQFLLRLDNVQHLATQVRGTLAAPLSALEVAGALHPTAAIGGTPTALALDRIRALEGMDRGRYGGPVGWVDAHGDGEFGIALRCAELTPTGARLFAGAGIVGDSRPEAELEETRLKLRAMQSALEEG